MRLIRPSHSPAHVAHLPCASLDIPCSPQLRAACHRAQPSSAHHQAMHILANPSTCMPLVQGELSQLEQYEGTENEAPDNLYGGKSQTIQAAGNGAWARGKLAESTPRNDAFLLRQWLQVGP